jgi:hypothetical protein
MAGCPFMSDPEAEKTAHRTRIQKLYATQWISLEEYEILGRLHGFVSKPSGIGPRQVASIAGYGMLLLGAAAQVISTRHPEMKGPLDALVEIGRIFSGAL